MAVKTKFGDGLQRGDILHVKVGMIDGDFKWIPTADDLERYADMWQSQVPEGVKVIVTPIGVETEIIGGQLTIKPDGHDMSPFSIVDIEITEPDRPEWPEELFDEDGLLKLDQGEYYKMRNEHGYGPAILVSDRSKLKGFVPTPRDQRQHYDQYMMAHSYDLKAGETDADASS